MTEEKKSSLEQFSAKIEKLSQLQRILISSAIFLIIITLTIWLSYRPKLAEIKQLNVELDKLNKELIIAKKNARDLKKFQIKMKEEEAAFKLVMKSLPEKEEIPSLLESISMEGQESGLEFLLFQPKGEVRKEFYAEIPVAMRLTGGYHNIATFFDRVARLPRVVNIRDIVMTGTKGKELSGSTLDTTCTAVTYKFVEPVKKAPAKRKKKKKKKKK